jgi:hypothetical protein
MCELLHITGELYCGAARVSRTPRDQFVDDSALEEDGFEPSVPLGRKVLERSNISTRRVLLHGGTEDSNPSSCKESTAKPDADDFRAAG